jgi:hypothetical protein
LAKSNEGGTEYVEKIFFIPPESVLSDCLIDNFDDTSGVGVLNYFGLKSNKGDKFNFPPIKIGMYFEEDEASSKKTILDDFVKKLAEHQNGIGWIVLFSGKNDDKSGLLKRRVLLMDELKHRGITCNRLTFTDGGVGGLPSTMFTIVHKKFLEENKVNPSCN